MRATWKAQRPKIGTAVGDFIPAPTGGWDAISALSNMPPDRAVKMDNWIPRPGYIEVRNGFNSFATGLGTLTTPVESVMSYNNYGTGSALFAAAGSVIYDITAGGVGVSKVTGLSNSRFQHKMFSNSSGTQYLVCVNGVDGVRTYNGSSWATQTITGTGVSSGSFVDVTAHKGRLWFVQDQSTAPVYMAIGAISGTGTTFELGNFMTKGGFVQAVGTWTVDTRQSVDEYIAFITSRGEVIVYQGTDPSSSTTWDLVGVYSIGPPIGRRCKLRIAGDLLIISLDGVNGMSSTLSTDRAAANRVSITANILNTMNQSAALYKSNFGWQFIEYAKGTLAIMNVPAVENKTSYQYVMNVLTGAWCRFTGINANCWEVDTKDNIYFGGNDGSVYQWDIGPSDYSNNITAHVESAYHAMGNAAVLKRWTMLQPLMISDGQVIPAVGVNIDFVDSDQLSYSVPIIPASALWDAVSWDQFSWATAALQSPNWISVGGIGHYISVETQVVTGQSKQLSAPIWGVSLWGVSTWSSYSTQPVSLQINGWNLLGERGGYV